MNHQAQREQLQSRIAKRKRDHKAYAELIHDLMKATTRQLKREIRQERKGSK